MSRIAVSKFSSMSLYKCFRNFKVPVMLRMDLVFCFVLIGGNYGQNIFRYFPFQLFSLHGKKNLWAFYETENLKSNHCRNILSYNYITPSPSLAPKWSNLSGKWNGSAIYAVMLLGVSWHLRRFMTSPSLPVTLYPLCCHCLVKLNLSSIKAASKNK